MWILVSVIVWASGGAHLTEVDQFSGYNACWDAKKALMASVETERHGVTINKYFECYPAPVAKK